VRFTVLSLPDLKPHSSVELATPTRAWPRHLALACGGNRLAVAADGWPAPFLFHTAGSERILPSKAHPGRIRHLFFPAGNKILRTICQEQHVCDWDAVTLRLLRRSRVPASLHILEAADSEGRQLLCRDRTCEKLFRMVVVEADTGKPLRSVDLPGASVGEEVSIQRRDDRRVVAVAGSSLFEIDHRAGKLLRRVKGNRAFRLGQQDRSLEGNTLFAVEANPMGLNVRLSRLDVRTGKVADPHEIPSRSSWTAGFVPGGRLVWVAESEQMRFLDRKTMKTSSVRRLRGARPENVTFSSDGSRYAFFEERWERTGGFLRQWQQPSPPVIRIHDRETGKTLGVIPCRSPLSWFRFRPDGKALAVVRGDELALWDFSSLER
jgi:hypothetical protein